MEIEAMRDEFKATMLLLLELLEHGETERAIKAIREILGK